MSLERVTENLASSIIHLALTVHRKLGPGLLESTYKECLYYELCNNGFGVEKEKAIPLFYDNVQLDCGYRADLVVENKIILELKSVGELGNIHMAQMLTYMRVGGFRLGFLINFNVSLLKYGIKRVVL